MRRQRQLRLNAVDFGFIRQMKNLLFIFCCLLLANVWPVAFGQNAPTSTTADAAQINDLFEKGDASYYREDFKTALEAYQNAAQFAAKVKRSDWLGVSWRRIGAVQRTSGRNEEAEKSFQTSLAAFEQIDASALTQEVRLEKARLNVEWSITKLLADQPQNALTLSFDSYQIGMAKSSEPEFESLSGTAALNIGYIYFGWLDQPTTALVWLEQAANLLKQGRSSRKTVSGLLSAARYRHLIFLRFGDYQSASNELANSESILRTTKNNEFLLERCMFLRSKADFYSTSGQVEKTLDTLRQGVEVCHDSPEEYADFYNGIGFNELYYNSNISVAQSSFATGYKIAHQHQLEWIERTALIGQAAALGYAGNEDASNQMFERLEKEVTVEREKIRIVVWQSEIAKRNRNFTRLKQLSNKYLQFAQSTNKPDSLAQAHLNLAIAELGLGNPSLAKANVLKSVALTDELRKVNSAALSISIVNDMHTAYRLLVSSELAAKNDIAAAEASERFKTKWLNDKILNNTGRNSVLLTDTDKAKISELSQLNIQKPENAVVKNELTDLDKKLDARFNKSRVLTTFAKAEDANQQTLQTDFNKLPARSAVLSFAFTFDNKLVCFARYKDGRGAVKLQVIILPTDKTEITNLTEKFRSEIINFSSNFKQTGRSLFARLIAPLPVEVKQSENLIIIPDDVLWPLPFQALVDENSKYLAETKAVAFAGSLPILLEQLKTPHTPTQAIRLAAFSNTPQAKQSPNLPQLPAVDKEVDEIGRLYGQNAVIGKGATKTRLVEMVQGGTSRENFILHIASHGINNQSNPFESYLQLNPTQTDDGRLTLANILGLKLNHNLVILSACETAVGKTVNGEGAVSLAWAFLTAGSSGVISSQWITEDKTSADFMINLHKNLRRGNSTITALHTAQLEQIKSQPPLNHPFYWADYVLIGDFR